MARSDLEATVIPAYLLFIVHAVDRQTSSNGLCGFWVLVFAWLLYSMLCQTARKTERGVVEKKKKEVAATAATETGYDVFQELTEGGLQS